MTTPSGIMHRREASDSRHNLRLSPSARLLGEKQKQNGTPPRYPRFSWSTSQGARASVRSVVLLRKPPDTTASDPKPSARHRPLIKLKPATRDAVVA